MNKPLLYLVSSSEQLFQALFSNSVPIQLISSVENIPPKVIVKAVVFDNTTVKEGMLYSFVSFLLIRIQ